MATKKPSKTVRTKIKQATNSNVFTAIAIFSILVNILLLVTAFVVFNPSSYNLSTVKDVTNKYCARTFSASDYLSVANDNGQTMSQAKTQHDITCKTSSFAPYYRQAVNSYQQSKK